MADWSNDPMVWFRAYHQKGGRPNAVDVAGGVSIGDGYGEDLCYIPVEFSPGEWRRGGRVYAVQEAVDDKPGLAKYRHRLQTLGASGTFNPAAETLIIACGLGWLVEVISQAGSNSVWGTDTSALIQFWLDQPECGVLPEIRPLILGINVLDSNAAAQFKAAGAGNNQGKFRNLVTEHMLEDWPLANLGQLLGAIDALRAAGASNVFHLVTATDRIPYHDDPDLVDHSILVNRMDTTTWAATLSGLGYPHHYVIDIVSGNVAGGV